MRGYIISVYFIQDISLLFQVDKENVRIIGDDNLTKFETFKRTPKADLEITLPHNIIRAEVQSRFQGINDIKQHKVLEARHSVATKKHIIVNNIERRK